MRTFIVLASVIAVANCGLIAAPLAGVASQYHAQDEFGQYTYGHSGGPSSKVESKTADGVVRGAYSYVDGNGLVQSAQYVADPINGFRVAATNLPVGPVAQAPVVAAQVYGAPAVRTIAAAPLISQGIYAPNAYAGVIAVNPTYTAAAAPLNNGAVHVAPLPVAPVDTIDVQVAKANHYAAVVNAQLRG